MIVLVTGGRDYADAERVNAVLDRLGPVLVIEGGAAGADRLARAWCLSRGVHYATVPALWNTHGKGSGPKRNAVMVAMARHLGATCVVFPGGTGTADCRRRAVTAGLPIEDAA